MADVKYTAEEMRKLPDKTDWKKLLSMRDEDIICDDEAPDVCELLESGRAKIVKRGAINKIPSVKNPKKSGKTIFTQP